MPLYKLLVKIHQVNVVKMHYTYLYMVFFYCCGETPWASSLYHGPSLYLPHMRIYLEIQRRIFEVLKSYIFIPLFLYVLKKFGFHVKRNCLDRPWKLEGAHEREAFCILSFFLCHIAPADVIAS